ncbi:hypothetical protein PoB_002408700 [Plakobranchus ocellatus]|uniref:Uncharacterized protein n=1 Tax=Plakobranchus ocellatus TaxID=259542 RepID=A0AAV3ZSQ7_9GAST|nr:hypothetical protein PoB_002408700 [Plakobranchus ocellatus]
MLAHLGLGAKGALLHLFNRTCRSGELPSAWHTTVLVLILKKCKCAEADEKLLFNLAHTVISKTNECMVNALLYGYLELALMNLSQNFGDMETQWSSQSALFNVS